MKSEEHIQHINKAGNNCKKLLYLTHFSTEQATFHVVYNGSLKINDDSLIGMLFRGPMFLQYLMCILLWFCHFKFAVCGDIKNMFFSKFDYVLEINVCSTFFL